MSIIVTALLLAAQAAPAAQTPPAAPATGGRSLAQLQERQRARLMTADTDKDGKLSATEFTASGRPNAQRQFTRMDADRDGFVTAAEIDAVQSRRFGRMDADGNGVLSGGEGKRRQPAAAGATATQ